MVKSYVLRNTCVATTKILPKVAIPINESSNEDFSDDESQYESTLPKERREEVIIDDSSEKSSDSESDSDQEDWVKHVTRSGCKTGLPSGWLDPSTGRNMQSTAKPTLVAISAVQNYCNRLKELTMTK